MTSPSNPSTENQGASSRTSALIAALMVLTGLGVAVAGLAPTAAADSHCDATVTDGDSIQAAVDAAAAGDTICVEAGSYDEALTVDTADLTLEGPNAGTPGDAADRADEATITGQVVLSADGVTFDGFDVSPPAATSNQNSEALRVSNTPDGVVVQNNVVREFSEDGLGDWLGVEAIVAFGGSANDAIEDVTIQDNAVHGIDGIDTKGGAAGVMIQGNVAGATVQSNTVHDIGLESTAWAQAVVVTGTGNHDVAPSDVTVTGNDLNSIQANPDTPWYGVGVGIESDGTGYVVEDNSITGNELGIEVKAAADEVTVNGNVISGNAVFGTVNKDDATLDATGNYWGSPLGPTHDDNPTTPTGQTGDEVSDGVTFQPWCVTPLCVLASA